MWSLKAWTWTFDREWLRGDSDALRLYFITLQNSNFRMRFSFLESINPLGYFSRFSDFSIDSWSSPVKSKSVYNITTPSSGGIFFRFQHWFFLALAGENKNPCIISPYLRQVAFSMCSSWHHSVTLEGTASSTAGSIFCRDKSVDRHSNNMEDMFIFTWSRWKLSDWQWQQELKLYWSLTHSAAATQTTTITFSFRLFQFPISNISMEHILKNDAATGMSFQCKNAKGQDFRNNPGFLFKWRNIKITSKLSIPGIKCSTRIRYKCSIPISKSIFSKAKVYIRGNMSDPARSTAPLNENWTSDSFKVHWFCYTLTWRPVKFWKAKSSSKMKHNENKSINHHMTISQKFGICGENDLFRHLQCYDVSGRTPSQWHSSSWALCQFSDIRSGTVYIIAASFLLPTKVSKSVNVNC